MKAGACFEAPDEKLLFDAVLSTGQTVPLLKISNNTARVYGIVAPEGVFTLDVTLERFEQKKPISAFEKGVKIAAVHYPFAYKLYFEKSANTIESWTSDDTKRIMIDDHIIELHREDALTKMWSKSFPSFANTDPEIIFEYGLV